MGLFCYDPGPTFSALGPPPLPAPPIPHVTYQPPQPQPAPAPPQPATAPRHRSPSPMQVDPKDVPLPRSAASPPDLASMYPVDLYPSPPAEDDLPIMQPITPLTLSRPATPELLMLAALPPDSPRTVARRYHMGLFSQFITPGERDLMPMDQCRRMLTNITNSRQELHDSLADMFNLPGLPPLDPPSIPDQPDSQPIKGLPSRRSQQPSQQPSTSPLSTTAWRHKWGEYFDSAPGSILRTRPHSPEDPEPHRSFTKAHNVGDTKDPTHDYYLRSQDKHKAKQRSYRHQKETEVPTSQPRTDPGSPATDPRSPNIEDILEEDEPKEPEDSAKPPRGHHEPPMAEDPYIPGALS